MVLLEVQAQGVEVEQALVALRAFVLVAGLEDFWFFEIFLLEQEIENALKLL